MWPQRFSLILSAIVSGKNFESGLKQDGTREDHKTHSRDILTLELDFPLSHSFRHTGHENLMRNGFVFPSLKVTAVGGEHHSTEVRQRQESAKFTTE